MNVVAEMLLKDPAPAAIWALLVLLAFPALLVLGSPQGVLYPMRAFRDALTSMRERRELRWELTLQAQSAETFAGEVSVAAGRAAVSAGRWQDLWHQAETRTTGAFEAWLDADARLRTTLAAAAYGVPWTAPTCAEYAARERHLLRAVRAAVGHGELPPAAIADAEAGRAGWDARLHPLQQDVVVRRATAGYLRERYEAAVTAERAAWHDAELSRQTSESLRQELTTAGRRAADLRRTAPAEPATGIFTPRAWLPAHA